MEEQRTMERLMQNLTNWRYVGIEITNRSTVMLRQPGYYCDWGKVHIIPAQNVAPGTKEHAVFTKTDYSLCGCAGVLTYELDNNQSTRLVIMFSNPLFFGEHGFALHITRRGASLESLFSALDKYNEPIAHRTRAQGSKVLREHSVVHGGIRVTGIMSQEKKAILRVRIEDAAGGLKTENRGLYCNGISKAPHGTNLLNWDEPLIAEHSL